MKVAERHYIDRQHRFFLSLDELSFKSKNLYNLSAYYMRRGRVYDNPELCHKDFGRTRPYNRGAI
ncbi:MAG: hypothetical protein KME26_22715 [Oscillatoria princeps RMCB-10]|nr:hypothetical protein [Oscillatoria princeps RMCB-10]